MRAPGRIQRRQARLLHVHRLPVQGDRGLQEQLGRVAVGQGAVVVQQLVRGRGWFSKKAKKEKREEYG